MPLLTVLAALCLQGCQDSDSDGQPIGQESVAVNMALSVAKSASPGISGTTRMTSTYITGTADNVELQCAIPFKVKDVNVPIGIEDQRASEPVANFTWSHATLPFFTSSCDFAMGVNAVLAYACPISSSALLKQKGVLDVTFGRYQPADISFRLQSIQTKDNYLGTEDVKTIPEQIADYLTDIANTSIGEGEGAKTWKAYATSEGMNSNLKLLFKNFTNQLSDQVGEVLPGSAANVKAWVTELWTNLSGLSLTEGTDDDKIRDAIIDNIKEKLNTATTPTDWKDNVKTAWEGFPASLELPEGAAVVRWDGDEFVPETQTTTVADINNLERFTYPAEIYYYGNSPTMVSKQDLSDNFSSKNKWNKESEGDTEAVLSGFNQGPVDAATKTVAMRDPLQYGVAQLVVTLKQTASTLPDSKGDNISVGNNFKLTGIIVGGQLPVGFDFSPEAALHAYSEADMRFIYDSDVNTNDGNPFYLNSDANATNTIQTLVLQSYWRRSLKLVLEFEYIDNGDSTVDNFKGLNGYVYEGTKFYLVGEIVPKPVDVNPEVYENRVFTKDHITTVSVTVNSLAKAYNVLPNLMSPRLEMGIELTPKWEQATTTDVIL